MTGKRGNALPKNQAAPSSAEVDYLVLPETGANACLSIHIVCINTMWYVGAHNYVVFDKPKICLVEI